jgi:hypothetical protein
MQEINSKIGVDMFEQKRRDIFDKVTEDGDKALYLSLS